MMLEAFAAWSPDRHDWPFLAKQTADLPESFRELVGERYRERFRERGQQAANTYIREAAATLTAGNLRIAASEDEIREEAARLARTARERLARRVGASDAAAVYADLTAWAESHHARIPTACRERWTLAGLVARLTDAAFWRRQLRRAIGRGIEGHAIAYGMVHRKAGLYASDDTVRAWAEQQRRNAQALEQVEATNEAGYTASLAELAAVGVANPTNRRHELMCRMKGFEDFAKEAGHVALFVTWTLPGAYHARHWDSGDRIEHSEDRTPREGAALLSKQWAKARAKLHRAGIGIYGFRVAEPHHDGTPHWHMVLFMAPGVVDLVRDVLRRYAYEPDRHELTTDNKRAARFTVKEIDPTKGSATGYLSKYISKNIDGGQALGSYDASEAHDEGKGTGRAVRDAAARVRAWASRWGIRQFQQIGGPGVTIWRELRRLRDEKEAPQGELFPIWQDANAGNWNGYVRHMGGATMKRADRPARLYREQEPGAVTRYGEEAPEQIKGIETADAVTITRRHEWVLTFKPRAQRGAPWTRVNNCTQATGPGALRHLPISTGGTWTPDTHQTTARDADGFKLFNLPAPDPALKTIHDHERITKDAQDHAAVLRLLGMDYAAKPPRACAEAAH